MDKEEMISKLEKIDRWKAEVYSQELLREAWCKGYDEGYEDGEDARPPKIETLDPEHNNLSFLMSRVWDKGYAIGYNEAYAEYASEAALKIKEEREDGKKHGRD